jgi:hypothetical protein
MKVPTPAAIRLALYRRLPRWSQPIWTYITALAPPGASRRRYWSPLSHLISWIAVLILAASLGLGCAQVLFDSAVYLA